MVQACMGSLVGGRTVYLTEFFVNDVSKTEAVANIGEAVSSLQNTKVGFEHEVLYVFCPQVTLFNFDGIEELVDIYTKFNLIDSGSRKRVVVISFHKRNKSIDYLFR